MTDQSVEQEQRHHKECGTMCVLMVYSLNGTPLNYSVTSEIQKSLSNIPSRAWAKDCAARAQTLGSATYGIDYNGIGLAVFKTRTEADEYLRIRNRRDEPLYNKTRLAPRDVPVPPKRPLPPLPKQRSWLARLLIP